MSVDEKPDSPMYVYESTVHCTNILLGLNDQRKKDILCDVTLIVERKEFRAHRAVLAACSEYFWQALVGQTKNDLVVSLPEEGQNHSLYTSTVHNTTATTTTAQLRGAKLTSIVYPRVVQ
ncbi:Transcription regulator protein BACH2 [Myotis brandtii]|uniref:Transcription regulator protein BACH2 n=1 Tax=Myotis brandtii TaxID=109478 RepID=S7N5X1_MYOBR|nr:Transcription regulator protein BACH2 [Myotis brandtii]